MKLIDLSGTKLNNITIIDRAENQYSPSGQQNTMWNCLCTCGNICKISSKSISKNENISCGCIKHTRKPNRPELEIGQRFTRLVVTSREYVKDNRRYVDTQCDCGNHKTVRADSIGQGKTESCGCLHKENLSKAASTHGESSTPLYKNYHAMLARCYNKDNDNFSNYGGRGIGVCDRWREPVAGFLNFKEDMGEKPKGFTVERLDVNGDYCPENCTWGSYSTQGFNRRKLKINTSGRTGVYWYKSRNKWVAKLMKDGKEKWLGQFSNFDDACRAIEFAEIEVFGFSRTEYCFPSEES